MIDETAPTETSETTASDIDASALGGGETVATTAGETAGAETSETGETALGGKPEAQAEAPAVPDTYDLTVPEGFTLAPEDAAAAEPVFKELGLTNDQANKLMPVAAQFAQRIQEGLNTQIATQVAADRKAWLDAAKADPEIGGAKWDESLTLAASGLDKLGFAKGSPFRTLLDESGLGNNPEMIRAWSKVGRALGEHGFAREGVAATAESNPARLLYPNDKPQGA